MPFPQAADASEPIDEGTIFLPFGDSLTEKLREERPVLYDRYFRIRSTATRIEATAKDSAVPRYRPIIVIEDGALDQARAQARADTRRDREAGNSLT